MSTTGPQWLVPRWSAPAHVRAAFTTRRGGVSRPPFDSLNLARHVGDRAGDVARNRSRLLAALELPAEPEWLDQRHGATVHRVAGGLPAVPPTADAAVTRSRGRVCAVLVADCVPVLLSDGAGHAIAAVHAGWRGLARGVLPAAIAALGAPPEAMHAWIGPAIGVDAYAVGAPLRARFLAADPGCTDAFVRRDGRWHMDLVALARRQLRTCGVRSISVEGSCVHADARRFYSHRRDGPTGRQAALVWLEP